MLGKFGVVTVTTLLVCTGVLASAGHLKRHQDHHHKGHHGPREGYHHSTHAKKTINHRVHAKDKPEVGLTEMAICVFTHTPVFASDYYSIGKFDSKGNLLETICESKVPITFDDLYGHVANINDWRKETFDDEGQEYCLMHKSVSTDAAALMTSYSCDD